MDSERKADLAIATDTAVVVRDISVPADSAMAVAVEAVGVVAVEVAVAVKEELAGAAATVVNILIYASKQK